MIPFLDLKELNTQYKAELIEACTRVIDSGWYIQGNECKEFDKEFAEYCGTKYAIGVAKPVSISINTFGTNKVAEDVITKLVNDNFDLRPAGIIKMLDLKRPIYRQTAAYGHMGRTPETVTKTFSAPGGLTKTVEVELFTWEKLDFVDQVKTAFGL